MKKHSHTFLEFFAGGGMARLGLGENWRCLFANDIDPVKCAAYRDNFGDGDMVEGSIADLDTGDLPGDGVDLAWASFPCQDLSLAGARSGIGGARSGLFFDFWNLIEGLHADARAPKIIVLENVAGLLTSNGGRDFEQIIKLMQRTGYAAAAGVLDAAAFTPQSRQRLFIVGFSTSLPATGRGQIMRNDDAPIFPMMTDWGAAQLPLPHTIRNTQLDDIIDWLHADWDSDDKTEALIAQMTRLQRGRLDAIITSGGRRAGAGFRRTRREHGKTVQRFEARFDGLAGCLRTPAGGSSRQILIAVEHGIVRTRLLSPREAARLMGLPEDYKLPDRSNAALKLCGDGVCVPVVRWLAENVLEPALRPAHADAA